jgi:solute carrier family 25 (mitochondrial phosphate transporter), member 3
LTLGLGPAWVGYSLQGLGKFGFYEMFKDLSCKIAGEEKFTANRKVFWAISSASAEMIADVLLCPFEAVKVRI